MNISNAVFEFTQNLVAQAASSSVLYQKQLHADIYTEIKATDTIRVDDLRQAEPNLMGDGTVQKDNAIINVHFVAFPVDQTLAQRLAARQESENMADAWVAAASLDQTLGGRVCGIGRIIQFNEWIKPGTSKMPVCVLRIQINPR